MQYEVDNKPVTGVVTVFLRNYVTNMRIGIYPQERLCRQRVRIDIAAIARCVIPPQSLRDVVDYCDLRRGIERIVSEGHVEFQESLCGMLLAMCLAVPAVRFARVKVAKLEAFQNCDAVGCEMSGFSAGYTGTGEFESESLAVFD